MRIRLLSLFVLFALAVATVGTVSAAPPDTRNFRTHLSGEEAGVETLAQGQAIFQFSKDGSTMHYKLIVANIDNVVGAHIHNAELGANGPIVVNLFGDPFVPDPGVTTNGVLAEGDITSDDLVGPLAGMPLMKLRDAMENELTYVNIHTVDHRPGEIRGQID